MDKYEFSYHPVGTAATPPMEGNWFRNEAKAKFPSAEGWHDTGPRENAIFVGGKRAGLVIVPAVSIRV